MGPEWDAALSGLRVIDRRVGRDRRASERSGFRCKQRIAPMRNGHLPEPAELFSEVECFDISAGGFSFLLDREPEFDTFAVVLGKAPREFVLAARIVRSASHASMGKMRVRIGCRFLRRLTLRNSPWSAEMVDVALDFPLGNMGTAWQDFECNKRGIGSRRSSERRRELSCAMVPVPVLFSGGARRSLNNYSENESMPNPAGARSNQNVRPEVKS